MKKQNWKLSELADKGRHFLQADGESNRIQWKPTTRQIRYYTTLGLLDKPFGGRGHGATYGSKHLLQLLAIKRLQHQGLKLAEIQSVLTGLSASKLTELLGFSQDWLAQLDSATPEVEVPDRSQTDFWTVIPEAPVVPVNIVSYQHFEISPGATLVASESALQHLDREQRQMLANDLKKVWQKYQKPE